jgi:hypothetical protein
MSDPVPQRLLIISIDGLGDIILSNISVLG